MESHPSSESSNKRPRSPTADQLQQSKMQKTQANHLQINYLARQYPDNLPLVSPEDNMPSIIHLVGEYDGVLQRHESIAGNLGACPLGPILIKRFERLFDGPPRVIKSHGKDGPTVTWLDVVEFAKSKPEQFNLEKSRNGARVCQFYTKQCRVEISEEDFVLIASGMPQKMIPPQPIIEDEEKELGALEILEKNLQQIIQMADQGMPLIFNYSLIYSLVGDSNSTFSVGPSPPAQLPSEEPSHRHREPPGERCDTALAITFAVTAKITVAHAYRTLA